MKILGDPIFAKNSNGSLKSRIGTIFFRTPGLVTQRGIHAMQRVAWIRALNDERAAAGVLHLADNPPHLRVRGIAEDAHLHPLLRKIAR